MLRIANEALTFDDVLLLPAFSDTLPSQVTLKSQLTKNIALNIPLLSSAMDTVTEARLAIAIAQEGGIGIVHKNMTIEQQAREVRAVKKYESGIIRDPVVIDPDSTIAQLRGLTLEHGISGVPVVEAGKLAGIITSRDLRFESRMDALVKM
jgi:IMP dehydrogenase